MTQLAGTVTVVAVGFVYGRNRAYQERRKNIIRNLMNHSCCTGRKPREYYYKYRITL